MAEYFKGVIGQERVKDTLSMFIDSAKVEEFFPPMLFIAPKGFGKTRFCHETAKSIGKPMLEINGATVKNLSSFIEQVLFEIVGQDITIFIDECHALPTKIQEVLLSILNVTATRKNTVRLLDMDMEFDLKRQTFLLATTEKQKIFSPLLDRLEEITFEDYKPKELAKIAGLSLKRTTMDEDALEYLAEFSRGNSRDAVKMGIKVDIYASAMGIRHVGLGEAFDLVERLNLYEFGLNSEEFRTLEFLYDFPDGLSLGVLCAKTGMTRASQMEIERYPQKHNLLIVDGKRKLTGRGRKYVERNRK